MKVARKRAHLSAGLFVAQLRRKPQHIIIILLLLSFAAATYYVALPPAAQAFPNDPNGSRTIVISQIYGGGGNMGATFNRDFIELFNRSRTQTVNITGWSVQYAPATNSNWTVVSLSGSIAPGKYHLVAVGPTGGIGAALPTPDNSNMSPNINAQKGKVALVNNSTALNVACPSTDTNIIDFVGYDDDTNQTTNCFEGGGRAVIASDNNTTAAIRNGNGCNDTDQNTADFTANTPNPRNSSSPANVCLLTEAGFASCTATRAEDGSVLLEWRTSYEVDNLGFNLYREENFRRTRINPSLVAGSALMVGAATALTAGKSYSWWDAEGTPKSRYYIEDIDLDGTRTVHGPFAPSAGEVIDGTSKRHQAVTLSKLNPRIQSQTGESAPPQWQSVAPVVSWSPKASAVESPRATPQNLKKQQGSLASAPALKIMVRRAGWYRVSQPELTAAGLDPNVNPRLLQLYADGEEQPISVVGEGDGRFDVRDALEFYGAGLDTPATDTRVYWLTTGAQAGRRINREPMRQPPLPSSPQPDPEWSFTNSSNDRRAAGDLLGDIATERGFALTVERKERLLYFSALRNGDAENFFGAVVGGEPLSQTLSVHHLDATAERAALEVALQGVSTQEHQVRVSLNDVELGTMKFADRAHTVEQFQFPHSLLEDGNNVIKLEAVAGETDFSLVDALRLTYAHTYVADNNSLSFTPPDNYPIRVGGFTNERIRVVDITDAQRIRELIPRVEAQGAGYAFTLNARQQRGRTFMVFTDEQAMRPAQVVLNRPSTWSRSDVDADLIMISHRDFLLALEPLRALRAGEGLSIAVVDVEDVYDEWSYGAHSPQAVKDFLAHAQTQWRTAPRFALLVGDASLDPRNYMGRGDFDFVPTKLLDTANMETASDDWLADTDGDGAANLPLGRLPVRSPSEATAMVGKIVNYVPGGNVAEVMFVADRTGDDGFDFAAASQHISSVLPATMLLNFIARGDRETSVVRGEIIAGVNRGPVLVNYLGHGSVDVWAGAGLLRSSDAGAFTNDDQLSLFVLMTCLNGYFQDPALDGLAESLLKAQGGAVAIWASSGMTETGVQTLLNEEFYRQLFGERPLTLGAAAIRAKATTPDGDARRTWILFGDPSMRLR